MRKLETKANYSTKRFGKHTVIFKDKQTMPVPTSLQQEIMNWYHTNLCHPGADRLEQTIRRNFTWKNIRRQARQTCKQCRKCRLLKKKTRQYGHLPAKKAEYKPWRRLCVDLIGPYPVQDATGKVHQLLALTMIDPATSWFEIAEIPNKTAETVALTLDRMWFCRYPRPREITYDQGGEFTGTEFQELLQSYGIKRKPATSRNPQSNGVIERVHLTLHNMLRTFDLTLQTMDPIDPWSGYLAAAAFAIRTTYHTTTQATPAELVFGRDMIFERTFSPNWEAIRRHKQQIIDYNNARENAKRTRYSYRAGDLVLYKKRDGRKHDPPYTGPFRVLEVYANGNVRIERNGRIKDRVNIRLLYPYDPR